MKPITKAVIGVVSAALLAASLAGCTAKPVTEAEGITIDGVYVNNSYKDDENDKFRMLYILYTVSPAEENLSLTEYDSISIGENTYEAEPPCYSQCSWITSHDLIRDDTDLYMGDTIKVVSLFKVPEHDLTEGKGMTFNLEDGTSNAIGDEELLFFTDDIVFCKSAREVGKLANPEGFKAMNEVCNSINGKEWNKFVNPFEFDIKFTKPNKYELLIYGVASNSEHIDYASRYDLMLLGTDSGKYLYAKEYSGRYTVKDGYISCSADYVSLEPIHIPYTWKNGAVNIQFKLEK